MEVKHRLAGSFAAIQHRAVALKELAFPSKLRGDQLQLSEYHLILLACVRQRFEMFPWANQDVRRRLRADILERDRKSTRLNSSHVEISYAVFCLKKKKKIILALH